MTEYFTKTEGVRLRPVEEWDTVIAYTRRPAGLHWITMAGWLVLELCENRPEEEIVTEYATALGEKAEDARTAVRACLESLEQKGLIHSTKGAHV